MSSKSPESRPPIEAMLRELFSEGLKATDPGLLVTREIKLRPIAASNVTLLALGKSAVPMARAAIKSLGSRVQDQCVVAPEIPAGMPETWMVSSHPTPSEASVRAAQALCAAASRAHGEILFLLSGGGSSLAALPAEGITLEEKIELVNRVYAAGVAIEPLNILRKHLSAFKGGGLAALATVPITTLLLSDVACDVPHVISSGPTLSDSSSAADALAIVVASLDSPQGPAVEFLRRRAQSDAAPSRSPQRSMDRHRLLAGIESLARETHRLAQEKGLPARLLAGALQGTIDEVASKLLHACKGPGLWVACGEATVRVVDSPGQGGRAAQLALYMAKELRGVEPVYLLVAGSDGIDGNSQAAGALVDHTSFDTLQKLGIDPEEALRRCDAASALGSIGGQIVTGPTGVNHADLILLYRPE